MNENIYSIFERRLRQAQERLNYAMKPVLFREGPVANIVLLKKYFGLSKADRLLIMPVFDELCFSEDGNVVFGRISDMWTLFDVYTGSELISESFPSLPIYHSAHRTLEIVNNKQQHGLYDIQSKKILLKAEYDEVDCSSVYDYLWVRKDNQWGFVNKLSNHQIFINEMDMAYEAIGGLFLRHRNKIICIDERGVSDEHNLRRFVLSHFGRGIVRNAKYHESVYFDIYGNILF